jgi:hypothetical protein
MPPATGHLAEMDLGCAAVPGFDVKVPIPARISVTSSGEFCRLSVGDWHVRRYRLCSLPLRELGPAAKPAVCQVAKLSNSRSIIPTALCELVSCLAKSNTDNEKRSLAAATDRKARRIVAIFRSFLESLRTIVWLQNGQPSGVKEVTTDARARRQPREKRCRQLDVRHRIARRGERLSALPRSDN